jgi:basic amino acid/polyamine antiporter, APA family
LLYCGVALVLTGMVLYSELDSAAPLAAAFAYWGLPWAQIVVAVGALLVCVAHTPSRVRRY